jgi:hypothetical protein
MANDTACLLFINQTGASISDLMISFTPTAAFAGQSLTCTSLDVFLSSNNCGQALTVGVPVVFDFFGGSSIPNNMAFFLAENGVSLSAVNGAGWMVQVPEPGSLLLLVIGLAVLIGFSFRNGRVPITS